MTRRPETGNGSGSGIPAVVRKCPVHIAAALLLVPAILLAGCTGADETHPAAGVSPVPAAISSSPTARTLTPAAPVATTPPVPRMFGEFLWAEYRENNTVTMPPNPRYQWEGAVRIERTPVEFRSRPAVRYRALRISDYEECCVDNRVTVRKDGRREVEEIWSDADTGSILGWSWSETVNGIPGTPVDYSTRYADHRREDCPAGIMGISPFGEMNTMLTDEGREAVTVTAGSWQEARRYTGRFRDGTPVTVWVVPDVPVPVQYRFPNPEIGGGDPVQTYELKGWG